MTKIPYGMAVMLLHTVPAFAAPAPGHPIVLHAARMLQVDTGRVISPGEILVDGERIVAAGSSVNHPAGAELVDLGDTMMLPGLIDAHVHLFLLSLIHI